MRYSVVSTALVALAGLAAGSPTARQGSAWPLAMPSPLHSPAYGCQGLLVRTCAKVSLLVDRRNLSRLCFLSNLCSCPHVPTYSCHCSCYMTAPPSNLLLATSHMTSSAVQSGLFWPHLDLFPDLSSFSACYQSHLFLAITIHAFEWRQHSARPTPPFDFGPLPRFLFLFYLFFFMWLTTLYSALLWVLPCRHIARPRPLPLAPDADAKQRAEPRAAGEAQVAAGHHLL
jgi:hypothetical protein